jgi:glutamate synthase (NADPH/NADH) large chain
MNNWKNLRQVKEPGFRSVTLPILFDPKLGGEGLRSPWTRSFPPPTRRGGGREYFILSDRGVGEKKAADSRPLAVAGLHHDMIRKGTRMKVGLVLESGEPRETHHFAVLLGYGVGAINPYMAYETIDDMINKGCCWASITRRPLKITSKPPPRGW